MSKQITTLIFAAALTVGPAIIHGRFTNRWELPTDFEAASNQVEKLPVKIGQWQLQDELRPLSVPVCRELGLAGHVHRRYIHSVSGHSIDVLLMVGPPGRLIRHPPEVCYANRANQRVGEAKRIEISSKRNSDSFRVLSFQHTTQPFVSEFSVAYAFANVGGQWSIPNSPRMAFGAEPLLYKLQVLSDGSAAESKEEIENFLTHLVAVFTESVIDYKFIESP